MLRIIYAYAVTTTHPRWVRSVRRHYHISLSSVTRISWLRRTGATTNSRTTSAWEQPIPVFFLLTTTCTVITETPLLPPFPLWAAVRRATKRLVMRIIYEAVFGFSDWEMTGAGLERNTEHDNDLHVDIAALALSSVSTVSGAHGRRVGL